MATEVVPRDVILLQGESAIKAGTQLCISSYAGARHQYLQEKFQQWQQEYDLLERDYKDGKVSYSTLVDAKKKFEDDNPGTILK